MSHVQADNFTTLLKWIQEGSHTRVSFRAGLSDNQCQQLANGLRSNSVLLGLDLGYNKITDVGAKDLARALEINKTLITLGLYGNKITDAGAKFLASAVEINKSLKELGLSGNAISQHLLNAISSKLKENERYQKELAQALETEVGKLLQSNGFEHLATAFYKEKLLTKDQVTEMSRVDMISLGVTAAESNKLQKIFGRPKYLQTEVGELLEKEDLTQYAKLLHSNGIVSRNEELDDARLETIGVQDSNDRRKVLAIFGGPKYLQTEVGELLEKQGLMQYAKLLYSHGIVSRNEDLDDAILQAIGIKDSNERRKVLAIFVRGSAMTTLKSQKTSSFLDSKGEDSMQQVKYDCFLTHNWAEDEFGRKNHETVSKVNDALKERGLKTWFDAERMKGFIMNEMTKGIDASAVVVAFITQTYIEKIDSNKHNDNCKLEFTYAVNQKSEFIIAVPMERRTLDASKWKGPVGAALGGKLYEANFAFDIEKDRKRFEAEIDHLYKQIISLREA